MQPPIPNPAPRPRSAWTLAAIIAGMLGLGCLLAIPLLLSTTSGRRTRTVTTEFDFATLAPATNPATLATGEVLFRKNCMTCHGSQGGGLIGPNLCDDAFIHGGAYSNTVSVISEGVPAKNMIAWKVVLSPEDLLAVASYTWSLRGTQPPNAKSPQGERTPGTPPDAAADPSRPGPPPGL